MRMSEWSQNMRTFRMCTLHVSQNRMHVRDLLRSHHAIRAQSLCVNVSVYVVRVFMKYACSFIGMTIFKMSF